MQTYCAFWSVNTMQYGHSEKRFKRETKLMNNNCDKNHIKHLRECFDCSRNGNLVFVEHNNKCLDFETPMINRNNKTKTNLQKSIWTNIFKTIQDLETKTVVMVSHHNLIKNVLLPFNVKKNANSKLDYGLANCSCVKIHVNNGGEVTLELFFSGFPDKIDHYRYIQSTTKLRNVVNTEWISQSAKEIHGTGGITIYLVRHGNAMHNKPIGKIYGPLNKPTDSSLTPMGVFQAHILGQKLKSELSSVNQQVFYFCSNLQRTQETIMTIREQIEGYDYPSELKILNGQLRKFAVIRILRHMEKNKKFRDINIMDLLIKDMKNIEEKLNKREEYNKLPMDYSIDKFKEYIRQNYKS